MIKLHRRIIETERLYLQPYALKHADTLFHLIHKNKPRLLHSFPKLLFATETRDATKDFVQQKIFDWNKNKAYALLLFNKEDHHLVGHLNVKDIDWKLLQCELAYFIDEDFKKQGLITEALNCVLKICF